MEQQMWEIDNSQRYSQTHYQGIQIKVSLFTPPANIYFTPTMDIPWHRRNRVGRGWSWGKVGYAATDIGTLYQSGSSSPSRSASHPAPHCPMRQTWRES